MRHIRLAIIPLFFSMTCSAYAQSASDASAVWKALQSPTMDPGKSASVEGIEIVRDRIHLRFENGTIQFAQPINGMVVAAVFHGKGRVQCDPPNAMEAGQLNLFTKQDKLDMTFTDATFSFTDNFFEDVAKQVNWQTSGRSSDGLYALRVQALEDLGAVKLPWFFRTVLSGDRKRTAHFLADLQTNEKGWVEVEYDAMRDEEINISHWIESTSGSVSNVQTQISWGDGHSNDPRAAMADSGTRSAYMAATSWNQNSPSAVRVMDTWMSFPADGHDARFAAADPAAHVDYLIQKYELDTNVASGSVSADLSATARVTVQTRHTGDHALIFNLDSNLRVDSVKDAQGHALGFYQAPERKNRGQSTGDYLVVVLAAPTEAGALQRIDFHYAGKRIVLLAGEGNYYLSSVNWYPTIAGNTSAFRSDFEMTFHSPKKYALAATGRKINETADGDGIVSSWKSEVPLAAAGFSYGEYKTYATKAGDVDVNVFANINPDDVMKQKQREVDDPTKQLAAGYNRTDYSTNDSRGVLSAARLVNVMGDESSNTLRLFDSYYGPYLYKQLVVTNITGWSGKGWPGFLYLSWITFLDQTQRSAIGVTDTRSGDYQRAHDTSYQWWSQKVGWKSGRDQWLSDGFADFSAILYTQHKDGWNQAFTQLRRDRFLMSRKDRYGHVIESLGPIWLGGRLYSSATDGDSYHDLVNSKGGLVLHMLRMMLYDFRNQDDPDHLFKDMMQDYTKTFDNKPASTEDFKAIVEKHMSRGMDVEGNHKMDWFFNEYVYGTGIPQYTLSYTMAPAGDGKTAKLAGKLTRTGVADNWKDAVAVYAHKGTSMMRLGYINALKPVTDFDVTVPATLEHFTINDYEDMLGGETK